MEAQLTILLLLFMGTFITADDFDAIKTSDERIIGGYPGHRPQVASLQTNKSVHICTGTVIAGRTLLTAASCCPPIQSGIVKVGSNDLTSPNIIKYNIKLCVPHKDYRKGIAGNNIAVVITSTTMNLGTNVITMRLPTSDCAHKQYYLNGWGQTSTTRFPNLLQEIVAESYSGAVCRIRFQNMAIAANEICVSPVQGKSVCAGDTGGPMHAGTLCAVISDRVPCGNASPVVLTHTFPHLKWIKERMLN